MAAETSYYLWMIDISSIEVTINGSIVPINAPGGFYGYGQGDYYLTSDGFNVYSYEYIGGIYENESITDLNTLPLTDH
ncbi:MAG TPA: hypothetical protein VGF01_20945 [Terracidiphilus sp.]